MFFLDFVCNSPGLMKLVYFIKLLLQIICIVTPIIIVVSSMIHLVSQLMKSEITSVTWSALVQKIVLGVAVFLVLPLVNSIMILLDQDDLENTSCWKNANLENIASLEAAEKDKLLAEIEAEKNKEEQDKFEDQVSDNINGSTSNGSSSGSSSGSSGSSSSLSYGSPCTGYVSSSSYNQATVNNLKTKARRYIGTPYKKMDCSDFVSKVYSDYVADLTAAGLAEATKNKCVARDDIRPGDVFFTSRYNKSGTCKNCGDRCKRWKCILHVGIVLSVRDGEIVSILHSASEGVHIESQPSYKFSPNSNGSPWYIMVTRPYA